MDGLGQGQEKCYAGGKEQPNDERVGAGSHINPLYIWLTLY